MKKTYPVIVLASISAVLIGCSSETTMTKSELDSLKNPSKEMPQAAKDAMANGSSGGGSSLSPKGGPPAGVPSGPPPKPAGH